MNPAFDWALINRGNVYVDLREYDLALADYNAALAHGEIPRAYMGLGDVYRGKGEYDQAIAEYEHALQLLPNYSDVYARLALVYLDQNKYVEALEAANQELTLDIYENNTAIARQSRGRAYYGLGEYEKALVDQNWIVENGPTQMDYYYRGLTYQALGQKEKAVTDLELFLELGGAGRPDKIEDANTRLAELRR